MKAAVVAIFDNKTGSYQAPFFVRGLGQAERYIQTQIMDPNTDFAKFPGDYSLMHLGYWDDETGGMEPFTTGPELIKPLNILAAQLTKN